MTNTLIKGAVASLAALLLSTAAVAESGHGSSGHGEKRTAAADSHAAPADSHGAADGHADKPAKASHGKKSGHGSGWSYEGSNGPDAWGRLSRDFAACGQGAAQSPIDLSAQAPAGTPVGDIKFDYRVTPVRILNNGHTVQLNYGSGSSMTVEGNSYELLQFHFHAPSEHAINGRLADMELHMVHRNAEGQLAVIGVMMNIGEENLALSEIWQNMPKGVSPERENARNMINARDFLPAHANYYRYMGSLTTPPCTEGVNWFVMAEPVEVSREQVDHFIAAVGHNNRPVQAVNNRLVLAPHAN